ncbi:MAG: ABC transporter ATP-binding protein [Alphaproteobacteria bacterium]
MDRALASGGVADGVAPAALLGVHGLTVSFPSDHGEIRVVDGISYDLLAGTSLGMVGESGCGKTMAALALLRLVPPPGRITGGAVRFQGGDLLAASTQRMESVRGNHMAMIFQEPMTALNPVFTVGDQIAEVLTAHGRAAPRKAWAEAIELLDRVGIPAPADRILDYPHSLSGGMRQRVMIAMALACRPALLIADEPTTALDVTVQARIIELLLALQADFGMAILFISHDLGVVSEIADEIVVMYAGRIVERASASELFSHPRHPYTQAMFETIPQVARRQRRLPMIAGSVPAPGAWPSGCRFRDRCPLAEDRCAEAEPDLKPVVYGHSVACVVAAP